MSAAMVCHLGGRTSNEAKCRGWILPFSLHTEHWKFLAVLVAAVSSGGMKLKELFLYSGRLRGCKGGGTTGFRSGLGPRDVALRGHYRLHFVFYILVHASGEDGNLASGAVVVVPARVSDDLC